ncbi:hypothetical protein [Caballeronia concitans]|uniref:Lipoprotein n=1 Tax=Caballeronia concitans TaxID=1777133 RepID=A0A658R1J8_9BURK|nr:hypothetical protein [Caballeronia concitans]KIG08578.1 hypothetical protein BurMR1_0242 [Burkholderia sp. MR1]SAL40142.1 hypothetical protein AWB72_04190 [Caballeronia concitans]
MKKMSQPKALFAITLSAALTFLSGCHDDKHADAASTASASAPAPASATNEPSAAERLRTAKLQLLKSVSGVWKPVQGNGLMTINATESDIQVTQGDTLLPVALGDVDPDNNTVNYKIFWKSGKQEVRTIQILTPVEEENSTTLTVTAADGSQRVYTLIRNLSHDDITRINALGAQGAPAQDQTAAPAQAAPAPVDASTNRGVIDMWLGGIDMNMRSCPGSTCAQVIVVPKDSKVSVDTSTIRSVTETSGVNTPWVRVTYEGAYCAETDIDPKVAGCTPTHSTEAPVTGWMNYTRLMAAPRPQQ